MCYLVPFVELSVSHASVLTILAITVERYYAICLPLQAGAVWTKSKGKLIVIPFLEKLLCFNGYIL